MDIESSVSSGTSGDTADGHITNTPENQEDVGQLQLPKRRAQPETLASMHYFLL